MKDFDLVCDFDEIGVTKSGTSDDMVMFGWASSPTKDADGERLLQDGLDLSHFREKGWVNWNHQQHEIIGVPTVAELRTRDGFGKCLYTEFKLIPKVPMAQHVWNLSKSLEGMGADRKLGLSIEGRRLDVGPKGLVKKAAITGMAVTPFAKNTDTSVSALVKAMASDDPSKIERFSPVDVDFLGPIVDAVASGIRKALDSGHNVGGSTQTGGSAFCHEGMDKVEQLIPSTVPGEGSLYKNLDSATKEACEALSRIAGTRDNKLTKGEAALFVHLITAKPLNECFKVFGLT